MIQAFAKKGIVGIYLLVQTATAMAADIKGVVIDKQSGEPLIGAAVLVDGRGAVPSSEADSHAFSFDIIPSSQIDHLVIVKSPSPEYPADFSGGFIQINA